MSAQNTASLFGANPGIQGSASLFGSAQSSQPQSNLFGSANTSQIGFGQSQTSQTGAGQGSQPTMGGTQGSQGLFGSSQPGGLFSSQAPANIFPNSGPSGSLFGTKAPDSSAQENKPPQSQQLFGGPSMAPPSGSLFGTNNAAGPSSFSSFSQPQKPEPKPNEPKLGDNNFSLSPSKTEPNKGSSQLFGGPLPQIQGQTSLFGTKDPAKPEEQKNIFSSGFGAASTQSSQQVQSQPEKPLFSNLLESQKESGFGGPLAGQSTGGSIGSASLLRTQPAPSTNLFAPADPTKQLDFSQVPSSVNSNSDNPPKASASLNFSRQALEAQTSLFTQAPSNSSFSQSLKPSQPQAAPNLGLAGTTNADPQKDNAKNVSFGVKDGADTGSSMALPKNTQDTKASSMALNFSGISQLAASNQDNKLEGPPKLNLSQTGIQGDQKKEEIKQPTSEQLITKPPAFKPPPLQKESQPVFAPSLPSQKQEESKGDASAKVDQAPSTVAFPSQTDAQQQVEQKSQEQIQQELFQKKAEEERANKMKKIEEESIDFILKRWDQDLYRHSYHFQNSLRSQKQMELKMMGYIEKVEELEKKGVEVKNQYLESKKGVQNILLEQKYVLEEIQAIDQELDILLVKNQIQHSLSNAPQTHQGIFKQTEQVHMMADQTNDDVRELQNHTINLERMLNEKAGKSSQQSTQSSSMEVQNINKTINMMYDTLKGLEGQVGQLMAQTDEVEKAIQLIRNY